MTNSQDKYNYDYVNSLFGTKAPSVNNNSVPVQNNPTLNPGLTNRAQNSNINPSNSVNNQQPQNVQPQQFPNANFNANPQNQSFNQNTFGVQNGNNAPNSSFNPQMQNGTYNNTALPFGGNPNPNPFHDPVNHPNQGSIPQSPFPNLGNNPANFANDGPVEVNEQQSRQPPNLFQTNNGQANHFINQRNANQFVNVAHLNYSYDFRPLDIMYNENSKRIQQYFQLQSAIDRELVQIEHYQGRARDAFLSDQIPAVKHQLIVNELEQASNKIDLLNLMICKFLQNGERLHKGQSIPSAIQGPQGNAFTFPGMQQNLQYGLGGHANLNGANNNQIGYL